MLLNWLKMANNPFRFLFCYASVFVGNMPETNIFERLECRNPVTNYPWKQRNEVEVDLYYLDRMAEFPSSPLDQLIWTQLYPDRKGIKPVKWPNKLALVALNLANGFFTDPLKSTWKYWMKELTWNYKLKTVLSRSFLVYRHLWCNRELTVRFLCHCENVDCTRDLQCNLSENIHQFLIYAIKFMELNEIENN